MQKTLPKIYVILGPTASGKSELALEYAQKYNGEVVSADSRQIYRGMDIGTAKVKIDNTKFPKNASKDIKHLFCGNVNNIPHYLINIVDPDEEYTLAQYKEDTIKVIDNILSRDKTPIIAGGTGLYIQAIVDNLEIPNAKPDEELRRTLNSMTVDELYNIYKKLDPVGAKKIDRKNKRRLVRAVEVCKSTGEPFSQQTKKGAPRYDSKQIGIMLEKEELHKRINARVDKMIESGLIEEVKKLQKKYKTYPKSFSGIGYKEILAYLDGDLSLDEAVELTKQNSRKYAKRQMTWFQRDKRIEWIKNNI